MEERLKFLVYKLKENQQNYFDEFYEQTKKLVFYVAFSVLKKYDLAEDIMQDTYLKFLSHIKHINPEKNIISYLLKITKNLSLNLYNKKKKEINRDLDYIEEVNSSTPSLKTDLLKSMKMILNQKELEIVLLHVICNLKHREISESLRIPLGSVTWTYNNAIDKLRRKLDYEEYRK